MRWLINLALIAVTVPAAAQTKDDCINKLVAAQNAGIVSSFRWEGTKPNLIVDERTWNAIEFSTKEGMARVTVCALLGPGHDLNYPLVLRIRSNLTDRIIGEWSSGHLTVK